MKKFRKGTIRVVVVWEAFKTQIRGGMNAKLMLL